VRFFARFAWHGAVQFVFLVPGVRPTTSHLVGEYADELDDDDRVFVAMRAIQERSLFTAAHLPDLVHLKLLSVVRTGCCEREAAQPFTHAHPSHALARRAYVGSNAITQMLHRQP